MSAVVVMAKAARPGLVKTRLHPLLGPAGAAALQEMLTDRACRVALAGEVATFVAFDPPDARAELAALVPPGVRLLPQRGGDLGRRMTAAVAEVAGLQPGPVVVLGVDAPTLTTATVVAALDALSDADAVDVVLGPALDGGYYLVGLRRPTPEAFAIDPALWSGPDVLAATLAALDGAGLRVRLLPALRDLDTPDDAAALLADPLLPADVAGALAAPTVSIVMPVLNEAERIEVSLARLHRDFPACEIVVVDGGSSDGTAELARPLARVVTSAPGRGRQLNAGARAAGGSVLWFHHADTVTEPAALAQLLASLRDPAVVGGGLTLRFDHHSAGLDYLAWTSNLRARRLGWVFGDQAMFVRRAAFEAVGGFPELPLMEDLEMSRALARRGRLAMLPATSTASARRFQVHGTWSMVVFMQYLKVLHFAGTDPDEIYRRYLAGPSSMLPRRHHPSERPLHDAST